MFLVDSHCHLDCLDYEKSMKVWTMLCKRLRSVM